MQTRRRGRKDQAARAALAPLVASGLAVCWRCNQPIEPGQAWDAGHLVDLATGGHPDGTRRPEHSSCNRSAGGRLGNARRRPTRRRLDAWLFLWPADTSEHPARVPFSHSAPRVTQRRPGPVTVKPISQVI